TWSAASCIRRIGLPGSLRHDLLNMRRAPYPQRLILDLGPIAARARRMRLQGLAIVPQPVVELAITRECSAEFLRAHPPPRLMRAQDDGVVEHMLKRSTSIDPAGVDAIEHAQGGDHLAQTVGKEPCTKCPGQSSGFNASPSALGCQIGSLNHRP